MNIQKILSLVLSVIMMIASTIFPAFFQSDPISNAEWLAEINYAFGMAEEGDTENAIDTAFDWGVIDSKDIDEDAEVTYEFAAKTLIDAAKLAVTSESTIKNASKLQYADKAVAAVDYGIFELKSNGKFPVGKIAKADALAALDIAKELWSSKSFDETVEEYELADGVVAVADADYVIEDDVVTLDAAAADLAAGDVFVLPANDANPAGAAFKAVEVSEEDGSLVAVAEEVDIEEVVSNVNFEGTVAPDFSTLVPEGIVEEAAGDDVVASAYTDSLLDTAKDAISDKIDDFLANPSVKFSIGDLDFEYSAYKNGDVYNAFDIKVSGTIPGTNGVKFAKTYSFSDVDISAKFDANLLQAKIKEAYVLIDYDLTEMTCFDGSYAASLGLDEDADSTASFLDKVKDGMFGIQSGGGKTIDVFSVDVPIGATSFSVKLTLSVQIDVYGKVSMTLTTNEAKGFEIINNKARIINDENVIDRQFDISGNFSATVGLNLGLACFKVNLIDVGFAIGAGAFVTSTVTFSDGTSESYDGVGIDTIIETTAGLDDVDNLDFSASVKFYGIMRVSVGQNSIINKIGLSKTWTIWDMSNKVFAEYSI